MKDLPDRLDLPRMLPLEEALRLGPAGLREQAKIRRNMAASMLGWIWPSRLQDEIDALEDELRRRGEEPEHLEVPGGADRVKLRDAAKRFLSLVSLVASRDQTSAGELERFDDPSRREPVEGDSDTDRV